MRHKTNKRVLLAMATVSCLVLFAQMGCISSPLDMVVEGFAGESRIVFHGLVVDQHGKPVEGAKVIYEVESFGILAPSYRRGSVKTCKDGLFTIKDGRGSRFFINDIELAHCVYPQSGPKTRQYEYRSYYTDCFKPDRGRPEVFVIRRKEAEAVYLYRNLNVKMECVEDEEDSWRGLDLRCGDCNEPRWRKSLDFFYDLELTWEHDAEKREWTVHVEANGENAGFQLLDETLYEAPVEGYVKERTFKVGYVFFSDKPPAKHVYLRLRDPGMYARLDITGVFADDKRLVIECKEYVNPYGDRCLEELELNFEQEEMMDISGQLRNEARDAMRNHKLAPRPPFEKWIKEGKAKY